MAVSTIRNKQSPFSNILIYILGIIGVGLVVFFGGEIIKNLDNLKGKSGLSVEVVNGTADVLIGTNVVGKTPFQSDQIKPGKSTITIKNEKRQYQTTVNFLPAKNDVIHVVGIIRDLGISDMFSSGQEFWFEKEASGNVLKVISEPSGATVYLDGVEVGKTPYASSNISEGTYELKISKANYESQTARLSIEDGYTLNGNIKLFPMPVPTSIKAFENSPNLYDLSLEDIAVTANTQKWVETIIYWNQTRGINLGSTGENKAMLFDYFIDYKGNIYNSQGTLLGDDLSILASSERGAYLGRTMDGEGLTQDAKNAMNELFDMGLASKTATILETGVGWLRVRTLPSLNGTEVTKVNVGETYVVLEEQTSWVKLKINDSTEGWVSSDYVSLSE